MSRSLGKKLRFEVFKRDGFQCLYCGATPPSVVLQVDHMQPVADGGSNDLDNLVTSCQPCNIGKGSRSLSQVPESLKDKAERIQEAEAQLVGYQRILAERDSRLDGETWQVLNMLVDEGQDVPRRDFATAKKFIAKIGFYEVKEAAEIASSKPWRGSRRFRYFCGVCINKLKEVAK